MKTRSMFRPSTLVTSSFNVAVSAMLLSQAAQAADGTWTNTSGGTYGTPPSNWSGDIVAGGTDSTADFSTIDITAVTTVALDSSVTLGGLVFGDTTPTADPGSGANYSNGNTVTPTGGWILSDGGNPAYALDLDVTAGSPVVTVNNLGTYYVAYGVVPKAATISAVIEGTEGLTKQGPGKLALSGANTFSGGLTVENGTVTLSGTQSFSDGIFVSGATSRLEFASDTNSNSNDISLSDGATLFRIGDSGTVGSGAALDLGTGGGIISYSGYSFLNLSFELTGNGAFNLSAANKGISLNGDNSAHTGGFNINTGDLYFSNAQSLPTTGSIFVNASGALPGGGAYATVQEWLDSTRIDTGSTGQIQLVNHGGLGSLTSNTEDVDMAGYNSLFLGVSTVANLGAGNILNFSGTIEPAGSTYRISGGRGATLALVNPDILTGARNLVVGNGTFGGTVNLNASNDFNGTTTVASSSVLVVAANGALSSGSVSLLGSSGLRMTGGLTMGNALALNGAPGDTAFGALHSLAGANTWTGNISLSAGSRMVASNVASNSLTIDGDIALGTSSLSFTAGSTSAYAGGDISVTGDISGSGNVTKNNATGTLTLTGTNSHVNTTNNGGTLKIGNGGTTGTLGSGNVSIASSSSGRLVFDRSDTYTVANAISGAGALVQQGSGTIVLEGSKAYTGSTTISQGTLKVNGSTAAASAVNVQAAGTLSGTGTVNGAVTASGTLAPGDAGVGTLNTGAVALTGTLAIEVDGTTCDKLASTAAIDLTGASLTVSLLGSFTGPYVIAEGTSVTGAMTVPSGYAVDISNGTQAVLTQTGTPADYAGWASANGVTGGVNGDSDNDGIPNGVEYGLNLDFTGSDGSPGSFTGTVVTFDKRAETSGNSDLDYRIEVSTDLGVSDPWAEVGAYLQDDASVISATISSGPVKNFARLRVVVAP